MTTHPRMALVVLAIGCGRGERESATPWAETTRPFDPDCPGCEAIGAGAIAHLGDVEVLMDRALDDPEAQWVTCLNGFMDCLDASADDFDGCMAASTCPEPCKQDYVDLATGADRLGKMAAVDAVFVASDGRCASPRGVVVEVAP